MVHSVYLVLAASPARACSLPDCLAAYTALPHRRHRRTRSFRLAGGDSISTSETPSRPARHLTRSSHSRQPVRTKLATTQRNAQEPRDLRHIFRVEVLWKTLWKLYCRGNDLFP